MTTRRIALGGLALAALLVAAWLAISTPPEAPEPAADEAAGESGVDGGGGESGRSRVRTRRNRSGQPDRQDTEPDAMPPHAETERARGTAAAVRAYQRTFARALLPFRREALELEALAAAGMVSQEMVWTAELEATLAQIPFSISSLFDLVEEPLSKSTALLRVRRKRLFEAGRETRADLDRSERALAGASDAAAWLVVVAREKELPDPELEAEEERLSALEAAAEGADGPELPDGPSVAEVRADAARAYLDAVLPVTADDPLAVELHVLLARAHTQEITYEQAVTRGRALHRKHPELGVEARGAVGLLEWYAGPFMTALRGR